MKHVRTCSEICIDANNHNDDLRYLSDLWKEVVANKWEYPLVQIRYIKEHLDTLVKEMAQRDAAELKKHLSFLFE